MKRQFAVIASVAIKIACGLLTIGLAARWLDKADFVFFVQFGFVIALGNLIATGGVIHGVVRWVAGGAEGDRDTIVGTALAISTVIGLAALTGALAFAAPLSELLVGSRDWGWLIVTLVPLTLLAGQGQILGGYLTGLGRAPENLIIQSVALLVATSASVVALYIGNPVVATLAFAAGLALQAPFALAWVGARGLYRRGMLTRVSGAHGRELMRYCLAFIVTATAMPAALFFLRDDYRSSFGVVLLAGWLAANRLSDVFTQLLGIYMGQIYLPEQASAARNGSGPGWAHGYWRHLAFAAAMMLAGLAVFLIAPHFWIQIGLGESLLPAVGIITVYLIGDVLRSWPSINLHGFLARGATKTYAAVEVFTAGLFILLTLSLKPIAGSIAPAVAYVAGNIIVGAIGFLVLWFLARDDAAREPMIDPATVR